MSMRAFLFAADALRLEEGVSFHVETPAGAPKAPRADVAAQNAQAMAAFTGMMGGVQKKRGRR